MLVPLTRAARPASWPGAAKLTSACSATSAIDTPLSVATLTPAALASARAELTPQAPLVPFQPMPTKTLVGRLKLSENGRVAGGVTRTLMMRVVVPETAFPSLTVSVAGLAL